MSPVFEFTVELWTSETIAQNKLDCWSHSLIVGFDPNLRQAEWHVRLLLLEDFLRRPLEVIRVVGKSCPHDIEFLDFYLKLWAAVEDFADLSFCLANKLL